MTCNYVKSTKSIQENAHYGRIRRRDVEYRNMQNINMVLVDADAYTVKAENCASWNEISCQNFVCHIVCSSFKEAAREFGSM